MAIDDDAHLECFFRLPAATGIPFVLKYKTISASQIGDARLNLLRQQKPAQIAEQLLAPNINVVVYILEPNALWKNIFYPQIY